MLVVQPEQLALRENEVHHVDVFNEHSLRFAGGSGGVDEVGRGVGLGGVRNLSFVGRDFDGFDFIPNFVDGDDWASSKFELAYHGPQGEECHRVAILQGVAQAVWWKVRVKAEVSTASLEDTKHENVPVSTTREMKTDDGVHSEAGCVVFASNAVEVQGDLGGELIELVVGHFALDAGLDDGNLLLGVRHMLRHLLLEEVTHGRGDLFCRERGRLPLLQETVAHLLVERLQMVERLGVQILGETDGADHLHPV